MRNAQFSHPVGPERLQQILYGACEPIPFDYERALSHANRSNDHRPDVYPIDRSRPLEPRGFPVFIPKRMTTTAPLSS